VGVIKMLVFTLPLIPSPQGRGDFKMPRRLCGGEVHLILFIQRAPDPEDILGRNMRINHGRLKILVAEQFLYGPYLIRNPEGSLPL